MCCCREGVLWDEHGLRDKKYYILVVRPTSVDGEYTRIGVGWIQSDYVVRQAQRASRVNGFVFENLAE